MASENGQEKREMLADIVAEIRAYGAQPPPRLMWLEIADRIEAAWKREKAEAEDNALAVGGVVEAARHSPGNAAAMREALVKIYTCVDDCDNYDPESKLDEVIGIADAALSAPPRNCDRFKTRKEARQYFDDVVCLRSNGCGSIDCKGCSYDSIDNPHRADCREKWLFAQAAERKGEN